MAEALLLVHAGITDSNRATRELITQMSFDAAALIEQQQQQQHRTNVRHLIAFVLIAAALGLLVWIGFTNRDNTSVTRSTADAVNDCTQPTGACFQANRRTLGESIADIVQQVTTANQTETQEIVRRVCIAEGGDPDECDDIARTTSTTTSP